MEIKWRIVALSAALLSFLSLDMASAGAENLSYSDLAARIEALENELNSQQVKLASCDSARSCCASSTSVCCATPACYFGYELTVLRPYLSEDGIGIGPFSDDYGYGHRFVFGYDGGAGMGARMRYWFYDHDHDVVGGVGVGDILKVDMDVLDLEITLYQQLRNWDLLFSGGFRYGRGAVEYTDISSSAPQPGFDIYLEGVGPTVSLEANRHFGERGFYLLGNFRASLLYADIDIQGTRTEDEIVTNLENQLGIGFTRDLGRTTLTLRTVWETQFWLNDTFEDNLNSNLGFAGPTTSAELRF